MLRRIKQWWTRAAPVKYLNRDVSRVTVEEWRANPEMVGRAATALRDPVVRQMIDACRNSHLGLFSGQPGLEEKAYAWCRGEGYSICLNNLEALAKFEKPKEPLVATFEDPDKETDTI